ncbi:hypothetical protein LCGC14_1626180 [marine sediment metagenome]|uniref:Serine protease n=1 Tax=marine sediment metagenome TaxID=412755 RepID=A0A0F9L3R1_9ZZZZ
MNLKAFHSSKILPGLLGLLLWAGVAQGLGFEEGGRYDPSRHNRFLAGTFPQAPVPNSTFILAAYEDQLRGAGWQTSRPKKKVALISPQHFLTANHLRATESITFLDASGTLQTFAVTKVTRISGDIAIGTLEIPVPEELGIRPFPVASVHGGGPEGRGIFYVGNSPSGPVAFCVGRTGFDKSYNGIANLDSELVANKNFRDRVIGVTGDSGSPSFFISEGELLLLGHHYTPRQDFVLGFQAAAVNAHLAASGYTLELRDAPEGCGDGAVEGAAAALAFVGWRQIRKGKRCDPKKANNTESRC